MNWRDIRLGPISVSVLGLKVRRQPYRWFCPSCKRRYRYLTANGSCDGCRTGLRLILPGSIYDR